MAEKGPAQICPFCGYQPETGLGAALYLAPGTLLAGKYLIGRVLGQGGFGITYLARDQNLEIRIAVKEFFPQGLVSRVPGANTVISYTGGLKDQFTFGVESFMREAKTLARFIDHPNIVSVRDFFRENGTAYMVMSFVEGLTLLEYLKQAGDRIPAAQAVKIIMPVTDALRELHRAGIMHRDISPDNIFIDIEGRIVLIDFGAARQEMREKSRNLSVILKAGYAPEEQYRSRGKQGPWTDIYAVAATLYHCITGQVPPEAMDRIMAEDILTPPSQLGVDIGAGLEQTLLKALAVKAEDRFQTVEEFQAELLEAGSGLRLKEDYTGAGAKKTVDRLDVRLEEEEPTTVEEQKQEEKKAATQADLKAVRFQAAAGPVTIEKLAIASDIKPQQADSNTSVNKKIFLYAVATVLSAVLIIGMFRLFGGNSGTDSDAADDSSFDPVLIVGLDADYYIDYEQGSIPIGDLPIGARVVDPSWEWEYRLGVNYSNIYFDGAPTPPGEVKSVTWIIVAHDHYEGLEPHVTLLTEELIGLFTFDDSTDHEHEFADDGYSHWGESGTGNAVHGLRPWLNSTGIHTREGFFRAFSESFKNAVLKTTVPNREWEDGSAYSTRDYVFVPSATELNDEGHDRTYPIGSVFAYFAGAGDEQRIALIVGDGWYDLVESSWGIEFIEVWGIYGNNWMYWTRSPDSYSGSFLRGVDFTGSFSYGGATHNTAGVRPVLNLTSDTLVSEINH